MSLLVKIPVAGASVSLPIHVGGAYPVGPPTLPDGGSMALPVMSGATGMSLPVSSASGSMTLPMATHKVQRQASYGREMPLFNGRRTATPMAMSQVQARSQAAPTLSPAMHHRSERWLLNRPPTPPPGSTRHSASDLISVALKGSPDEEVPVSRRGHGKRALTHRAMLQASSSAHGFDDVGSQPSGKSGRARVMVRHAAAVAQQPSSGEGAAEGTGVVEPLKSPGPGARAQSISIGSALRSATPVHTRYDLPASRRAASVQHTRRTAGPSPRPVFRQTSGPSCLVSPSQSQAFRRLERYPSASAILTVKEVQTASGPIAEEHEDMQMPIRLRSVTERRYSEGDAASLLSSTFDRLDMIIRHGDVLCVTVAGGANTMTRLGANGGFMGHVLLVAGLPRCVTRDNPEATSFERVWPEGVAKLWLVRTVESTRAEESLHETTQILYVDSETGTIHIGGEERRDMIVKFQDPTNSTVEVWQSPAPLRSQLRADLFLEALAEVKAQEGSWSWSTAVRAFLMSAEVSEQTDRQALMQQIQNAWRAEPICTSVVLSCWQRYLCKLAENDPDSDMDGLDLIMFWLPMRADRTLPGELLKMMRFKGWSTRATVIPAPTNSEVDEGSEGNATPPPPVAPAKQIADQIALSVLQRPLRKQQVIVASPLIREV